jgi:hypothetical protein
MMRRIFCPAILFCGFLSGVAVAGDVPDVKTGLWSTTTNTGDPNAPRQTVTMCTSTALLQTVFDQHLKDPKQPCKQTSVSHNGATTMEQNECKFGDTITKSKVITVTTGNTAVHTEIHQEGKSTVTVSESKYVGACPPGMQLGDYVGPDGKKSNVLHPGNVQAPAKAP